MPKIEDTQLGEEAVQGDGRRARSCAGRRCGATTWRRSRRSGSAASARTARRSRLATASALKKMLGMRLMPRVKRAVHAQKKRRKVLEQAKGYWGRKSTHYRYAKEQVEHSLVYAYRDRKVRKREFRQALDHADQRRRARERALVQPVRQRLLEGRHRARPQGARGPRGQRSRPRSRDRRAGEGRARVDRRLITSRDNERLKLVRKLHERRWRDKLGLFAVEGEDLSRRRGPPASSRWTCSSRGRTSRPSCWPRCRRSRTRRASSAVFRRADLPRGRAAGDARALARGGSRERRDAHALRGRVRRRRRALGGLRRSDRSEGGAGVDGRDLPRPARRASTSRAAGASRSSRAAAYALPELAVDGDVVLVLGAEREGLPADVLAALRRAGVDPAAGRRRVAQRRDGRHDRALRARSQRSVTKKSGPFRGPDQRIRRAGFAFVRLVQPAFRLGIAPSSSDRSVEVST